MAYFRRFALLGSHADRYNKFLCILVQVQNCCLHVEAIFNNKYRSELFSICHGRRF